MAGFWCALHPYLWYYWDLMNTYRQNPRLYYCPMGSELLVLQEDDLEYFRLNGTAAAILELLREPKTAGEIVSALTAEFDVTQELCGNQVSEFLKDLVESNLVVCC